MDPADILARRVLASYVTRNALTFPTPKALKEYLQEHPKADKSKHTVEKGAPGDKPEDKKPEEGKKQSLKERLTSLSDKAKAFMQQAPQKVQDFIEKPEVRKEVLSSAAKGIKEAPEKFAKNAVKAVKHEIHEWKTAGQGVRAALKGEKVTPEQKKAIKTVAVDIAITVAVTALSGGLAGGAAGLAKSSALALTKAMAKKIALNAVTNGLGHLVTLGELGHGAPGAAEMFHHVMQHVAAKDGGSDKELLGAWVTGLVAKELEKVDDDLVLDAVEKAGKTKKEANEEIARRVVARVVASQDPWLGPDFVEEFCPDCAARMRAANIKGIRASVLFGADEWASLKTGGKWNKLPKGWTEESLKKFWGSLTGKGKHKVTACIKKMEGKVDNPGAFCASLADRVTGDTSWRSKG